MLIILDIQGILWAKIFNTLINTLLAVISHPFELFEDYRYAESRLLKNLHQKSYIFNVKVFPFPKITMTFWSKVLVCILHPNYVF